MEEEEEEEEKAGREEVVVEKKRNPLISSLYHVDKPNSSFKSSLNSIPPVGESLIVDVISSFSPTPIPTVASQTTNQNSLLPPLSPSPFLSASIMLNSLSIPVLNLPPSSSSSSTSSSFSSFSSSASSSPPSNPPYISSSHSPKNPFGNWKVSGRKKDVNLPPESG